MAKKRKPKFYNAGDRIIMDISIPEARTLKLILDRCGGDPNVSPRGYVAGLFLALEKAGIVSPPPDDTSWCEGDISFHTGGDIAKDWPVNPNYKGFMVRDELDEKQKWIDIIHGTDPFNLNQMWKPGSISYLNGRKA